MKVLFANATHRRGGVKSWTLALARGLVERGHRAEVVLRPGDPFGDALAGARIPVHRVRFGPDWNPAAIAAFTRRLKRDRHDLLVTNVGKDNRTAGVAARLSGVPVIHRVGGPGDLTDRAAVRWTHRHVVSAVVVPSRSTKEALCRFPWVDPGCVTVIPNGIDLERFRPGTGAGTLRALIGGGGTDDFLIATTGQLTALKGHRYLVEAAARLRKLNVPVRLALIGTGPEEARLRLQAESLGITPWVHFPGLRDDIDRLLEDCVIAAQPSLMEGLPHSVVEFLAKGKPVVASRLAGIEEAVDESCALLVPPEAPEAIVEAVQILWRDSNRLKDMRVAARRRAESLFDRRVMIDRTEALFEEIAGRGRTPR